MVRSLNRWLGKEMSIMTSEGQNYTGLVIRGKYLQYSGDHGSPAYFLQTPDGEKIFLPTKRVKSDNEGNLVLRLNMPTRMVH